MTATREELAWAAGLFEGEGCICFTRSPIRGLHAILKMTDEDVVRRFHSLIGFGNITTVKPQQKGWKLQWSWQVGSFEHVQALIAALWPWLHSRRRAKAKECIRHYHSLESAQVRIRRIRTSRIKAELVKGTGGTRWKPGKTQRQIASQFGVSPGCVTLIKQRLQREGVL